MPERHSTGSSGGGSSSSSGGSSGGSGWSSSSSGGSHSSWSSGSNYNSYNRGPQTPEQQALNYAIAGIAIVIFACIFLGNLSKGSGKSNQVAPNYEGTATTQAITVADLKEMNTALEGRIPIWKKAVTDLVVHRVSAPDAGFGDGTNTKEVDYGYCAPNKFYVYVLESSRPGGYYADTEGYVYTPDARPNQCIPAGWIVSEVDDVGGGWYFITLNTLGATQTAIATLTPRPSQAPPTVTLRPNADF